MQTIASFLESRLDVRAPVADARFPLMPLGRAADMGRAPQKPSNGAKSKAAAPLGGVKKKSSAPSKHDSQKVSASVETR